MMACPCCGKGGLSTSLLIVLESIRKHFNCPVTIESGARCVHQNLFVGGSKTSLHLVGSVDDVSYAADIKVRGILPETVVTFLEKSGYANLLGIGIYDNRIHVDTRGHAARWDMRT